MKIIITFLLSIAMFAAQGIAPIDSPIVKWKFKTNGRIYSSPALSNGIIFIGSEDKNLYAIEATTGHVKWSFKTDGAVHSTPTVYSGTVYFGSFDGYYYAIDEKTGKEKWKFKTGGEKPYGGIGYWGMKPENEFHADPWEYFLSSPIVDVRNNNATIYFGSSDNNLYALDAVTGKLQWKYKAENIIHTTPVINGDLLYISSWDALHAIDLNSHEEKWNFHTGTNIYMRGIQSTVAVAEGNVYFGTRDGLFFALNAMNGNKVWADSMSGAWVISSAKVKNGHVYVGTSDSYLMLSLNAKTGQEEFRFKANGYIFNNPSVTDKNIYFGDYTGKIYSIDIASEGKSFKVFETDGRKANAATILNNDRLDFGYLSKGKDASLYSTTATIMQEYDKLGPILSSPLVDNDIVYVGSADGFVYALKF